MTPDTLMLVPGLACDAEVWQPQVLGLDELVRNFVLVEHGLEDSLAALAAAALAGAPKHFALAGHSMGGRVALEIVRQAPERVTRLALLDTGTAPLAAGKEGEEERAGRLRLLEIARTQGMRAMAEDWSRNMVHPEHLQDRRLMNRIHDMFERSSPQQFASQVAALLARPDAGSLLARIRVPTLVLCGAQDQWSPLARHRDMAERIPHSTLVCIPRCGHMSTLEQPQAVSDALRAWLTGAPQVLGVPVRESGKI